MTYHKACVAQQSPSRSLLSNKVTGPSVKLATNFQSQSREPLHAELRTGCCLPRQHLHPTMWGNIASIAGNLKNTLENLESDLDQVSISSP